MSAMETRESEQETFEFDQNDAEAADLWVDETSINRDGDARAVLAGDTYEVLIEGGVKENLDWETTQYEWDDRRKEWSVDVAGLEHLKTVADEQGFTVNTTDGVDEKSPLLDATEHAEKGATIEVKYAQKNGNGTNTKVGEVREASLTEDGVPIIVFVRDGDNQIMRVKPDDHGDTGLFSGGYHPFVGAVTVLKIRQ